MKITVAHLTLKLKDSFLARATLLYNPFCPLAAAACVFVSQCVLQTRVLIGDLSTVQKVYTGGLAGHATTVQYMCKLSF